MVDMVDASTGTLTTFAGKNEPGYSGDGGLAVDASLSSPSDVAIGSSGIYVSDTGNSVIRYVSFSSNDISTVAGNGSSGDAGDNGPATSAEIEHAIRDSCRFLRRFIYIRRLE